MATSGYMISSLKGMYTLSVCPTANDVKVWFDARDESFESFDNYIVTDMVTGAQDDGYDWLEHHNDESGT